MAGSTEKADERKQIIQAIEQSNVYELRRIFAQIAPVKKEKYLNDFWLGANDNHAGYTLLHLSIVAAERDVCQYLLQEGAKPNQYDLHDNTPLHLAALHDKRMMIRLLIKYGADPSIKNLDNKSCAEMPDKKTQRKRLQSLIEQCVNEKEELQKMSNLPFQNSDDRELKKLVSTLTEDTVMEQLLEIIGTKTQQNEQQTPDIKQMVENSKWNAAFSDIGITVFQHLLLPASEEWPLTVQVPVFVIYCLERIIHAWSNKLGDGVSAFNESTKIMEVLFLVNDEMNNQYIDKLPEYEARLIEHNVYTMKELAFNVIPWDELQIDEVFCGTLRNMISSYIIWQQSNKENAPSDDSSQKRKDPFTLLSCETVSCIVSDDKFIHVATMDGKISAFDMKLFEVFHEFQLVDNKQQTHVPLFMQFLDRNHEQLVTSDKDGNVCCWYLHSKYPRKRAKCIRMWPTHDGYISSFGIPKQSESIFTIGLDGYLRVRNMGYSGNIMHSVQYSEGALTAMTFLSKTCVLIGTENGVIMQIDIAKEKIVNILRLSQSAPIRCLCVDQENDNNHCYFSFADCSIGLLDMSDEWRFVGKFAEGFEHHQSTVNHIVLRNDYLWSCSEDGSIRIWCVEFLRENLQKQSTKKKAQNTADGMPNCMTLGDAETLNSNNTNNPLTQTQAQQACLLEAWCLHKIDGMFPNGVQRIHFMENESLMFATAYQPNVIAFDLSSIDTALPEKEEAVIQRRQQLNNFEKALQSMQQKEQQAAAAPKDKKKGKGGKKKK